MVDLRDVVIVIPTKRQPSLRTLDSFEFPPAMDVFIIADPSVFRAHRAHVKKKGWKNVRVLRGAEGLAPQVMECYRAARAHGYKYFFRLDDDLAPDTFILKDRTYPPLKKLIRWARECMDECNVSLVGFANTSRLDWLGEGYGRSYALVTGAIQLCRAFPPEKMLDVRQERYEDVYRSLSHRQRSGAVGRVKFVGVNKRAAHGQSTITITEKQRKRAIRRILRRFPDFVTYLGDKKDSHGTSYPVFRYKRHPEFVS